MMSWPIVSSLVQVTTVPTLTVMLAGLNDKSRIVIATLLLAVKSVRWLAADCSGVVADGELCWANPPSHHHSPNKMAIAATIISAVRISFFMVLPSYLP